MTKEDLLNTCVDTGISFFSEIDITNSIMYVLLQKTLNSIF